jgi:hypothetical protein
MAGEPDLSVSIWGGALQETQSLWLLHFIDFSTWTGFGELWGQLKQRKYWGDFLKWLTQRHSWGEWELKNPFQRADAIFEFRREKGEVLDKGQG